MNYKTKRRISKVIMVGLLSIITICMFFSLYFMIISSFKNNAEIASNPFWFNLPLRLKNYVKAYFKIFKYMKNSVIITSIQVAGTTLVACITAYVFARFEFPFKNALYTFLLAFLMIPGILTLIPMFLLVHNLGIMGTIWSVILPSMASAQITFIIILKSFIEGLPKDLFDSALIDGATHRKIFLYVVFPLTKPTVLSLALMAFLDSWNDFLWPMLCLSSNDAKKTITLGLYAFRDVQQILYGPMFAGFVIASVPMVILFCCNMKYFITGITAGAVKG